MAEVAWDLLAQYPNAGQSFLQSFQQGIKQNQERAAQNALSAYALDPNNSTALATAIRTNPESAISLMNANTTRQREQAALTQQQHEQWTKYAGNLAKWADTPQKWDQAIDYLLSSNHPEVSTEQLQALKGHFDPALRQSFMAQAGISDPGPTDLQRNVDYMNGQQPGLGDSYLQNEADKPQPVQTANPDGTITVHWVRPPLNTSGSTTLPSNLPRVSDQKGYDALAPGAHYLDPNGNVRTKGGQSGAGSTGGF